MTRDDAQGPAAGRYIADTLKARKVYVLNDKTAYGEGLASEVERTLKSRGVTVVGSEGTEERNDFSSIITKIQAYAPDVVYFGSVYDQAGVFIKQLRAAGVGATVMGGDGWDSAELRTIGGKATVGALYTATTPPVSQLPNGAKFDAAYRKAFKRAPGGFAAFSYDAARVALEGMLAAAGRGGKAPSRTAVESAVRKANVKGLLSGDVRFDARGDRARAKLYVMKVGANLTPTVARTLEVGSGR